MDDEAEGKTFSDPVEQIRVLLAELKSRNLLAPVCLGTVDAAGASNGRFVDLKEVRDGRLLFGTDSRSVKAQEFDNNAVSLTAWWEPLQVQVRVRGTAVMADAGISDRVFADRSRSAQALAALSYQSAPLPDVEEFKRAVLALTGEERAIKRPAWWNVYGIVPATIEILRFSEDRIHVRTRYTMREDLWEPARLSP